MAAPFRVKALYEYSSPHDDDLNFAAGQIITVTDQEDADWYEGEYLDDDGAKRQGIFPCNFVEKYEPTAPPRPARTRPKKDPEAAQPSPEHVSVPPPAAPVHQDPSQAEPEIEEADAPVQKSPPADNMSESRAPPAPAAAAPASATKKQPAAPPPVSDKPSGNSFKDRIAAFNKPAAPPVAPFKPSGLSGGGGSVSFIKKPFVAPPPSRNAYVPPPRETPTTPIYRRDEDPEIKEREAANLEQAEKAGLATTAQQSGGAEEDQPKPTSLKERIALLQKQQMEQAQRHAEAAAKKDKPKKPPKKVTEASADADPTAEAAEPHVPAPSEHREAEDTGTRTSTDEVHPARAALPPRRKSSKGPATELVHDSNDADMSGAGDTSEGQDDTTEREDSDETSRRTAQLPSISMTPSAATAVTPSEAEVEADEAEQEDEDDVDPEVRRKEELRARMAKMSGGMGFHGMFGAPVPPTAMAPPKKKAPKAEADPTAEGAEETSPISRAAPPIPTPMALPGMGGSRASEETKRAGQDEAALPSRAAPPPLPSRAVDDDGHGQLEDQDEEDEATTPAPPPEPKAPRRDAGGPPPVPGGRPGPPPVPADGRPPPPPPAADLKSATDGSESDDELSARERNMAHESSPLSPPLSTTNKRNSRPPPPIPGSAPAPPPAHGRPPPPPPPGGLPPPQAGEEENEENTEYEGDYDTDIASSVPHKDALKAHARDSSLEDNGSQSPAKDAPPTQPPPPPPESSTRRSVDVPRAAPPLPPQGKEAPSPRIGDDYDTHNHAASAAGGFSSSYGHKTPKIEEEAYFPGSPSATSPPERRVPPATPGTRAPHRQSMDVARTSMSGRRSTDIVRPSMESGFIANDIDLAVQSGWWKQANQVPPVLQGRRDMYFESEESMTTNQGSKTTVTREIFVLFQDYSQTVLTVRYDPYNASDVELEQRHESPPRALRQDQMEEFHDLFGRRISEAASSKKDTVVGDGTPQGLVAELLRPFKDALRPVGTRAYGALVYSNMANASTQQHDVIRPGDIMSVRNAKFQGKHGPMHAKYSAEVGKPDHVAVVAEWDGTKKKVRAWEQGRESKKVKLESFKLDDLRSGEVKIWRVVPRSWVGWNGQA
ncbi:SH3 domain-containing protein [Hirsutella rhossiliensis]|uniref:SH3 domain-containing protein n=1 Tax=Hirsutella rhossiliensis TaxID=111463 RepID=A0A9P8MTG8_9HYPO|nr:SH3 domain-containing protein [Hirsutella rhossiliensis]KAH0960985.1 SH3 domain-containing protein [Hirsutella rhossiliensis]